jgi:hypothetical protein
VSGVSIGACVIALIASRIFPARYFEFWGLLGGRELDRPEINLFFNLSHSSRPAVSCSCCIRKQETHEIQKCTQKLFFEGGTVEACQIHSEYPPRVPAAARSLASFRVGYVRPQLGPATGQTRPVFVVTKHLKINFPILVWRGKDTLNSLSLHSHLFSFLLLSLFLSSPSSISHLGFSYFACYLLLACNSSVYVMVVFACLPASRMAVRATRRTTQARSLGTGYWKMCSPHESRNHSRRPFYSSSATDGRHPVFAPLDTFARRHIGPSPSSTENMLKALNPPADSLDHFVRQVLPANILSSRDLKIDGPLPDSAAEGLGQEGFTESQLIARLRQIAKQNKVFRSYIGCGYAGTKVPEVIKRNVLEGPGWYTSYTPYQPEISQGSLSVPSVVITEGCLVRG